MFINKITLKKISLLQSHNIKNCKINVQLLRFESSTTKYGFDRKMNDDLRSTVKSYTKHVLICDGSGSHNNWPSKIENMDGLKGELAETFRKDDDIRVIACDLPSQKMSDKEFDLIYFDSTSGILRKIEDVNKNNMKNLIKYIKHDIPHPSVFVSKFSDKVSLVMVCAHQNKDIRCGYCGPIIADKIEQVLIGSKFNKEYVVTRVSHIGGHKYAANVIFYPQGDWYGYIKPEDVASLMETVDRGEILESKWRGSVYDSNTKSK